MTAKGKSLESILEALCRVVEQAASGSLCSVILIDPNGSKIQAGNRAEPSIQL
jgi:hypothetical protein